MSRLLFGQAVAKGVIEAVVGSQNAIYFPAAVANRCVGPLHQGGNVGLAQTQQEQITVIHIAFGQP